MDPTLIKDELNQNLEAVGGLATAADLARRWGISRASMTELRARHAQTFPQPRQWVSEGKQPLFAVSEADEWRKQHRRKEPDAVGSSGS